ncbi:MAG: pyruvate kinase [Spirochaetales bacterium]|nr:pyruvate kinase [Spirochaetales bacterium]
MIHTRPTKIVCTIGPATSSLAAIRGLVNAGMNVARLNFSHGTWEEHEQRIETIRAVEKEYGTNIAILQDLGGPKIRTGNIPPELATVETGDTVRIAPLHGTANPPSGTIPIGYDHLLEDIPPGGTVLVDDGKVELEVLKLCADSLTCRVVRGGRIESRKGVTFPDQQLQMKTPTDEDLQALEFGLAHDIDYAAVSFVQSADDIERTRDFIKKKGKDTPIIAKIERKIALQNIEKIILSSDAVMVARGDLGVESDITMVPVYQERIVRLARNQGKAVIIATQMLESMMESELPLRAEASDIANAVYSGADAIMLSGETSVGHHPEAAVRTMARIAGNMYQYMGIDESTRHHSDESLGDPQGVAMSQAACMAARQVEASYLVAHTLSGKTARLIARQRPPQTIVAITPLESTRRRLALYWGVSALFVPGIELSFLQAIKKGDQELIASGLAKPGEKIIVTAGIPEGRSGVTNIMKIHIIGSE